MPLPLGSNRDWSVGLFIAGSFLLLSLWSFGVAGNRIHRVPSLQPIRVPLTLYGLWLLWGLLQIIPIPELMMRWLSPAAAGNQLVAGSTYRISLDLYWSVSRWMESAALLALMVVTWMLLASRRRVRHFMTLIIAVGVVEALYGVFMTLSGLEFGSWGRKSTGLGLATGTFINRNHFAGFLVIALAVGIGRLVSMMKPSYQRLTWRQRVRNISSLLLSGKMRLRLYLAFMVVALVMTHSRMGNIAFFSSMLIAGILALTLFRKAPRPLVVLIVSLIVIDITIIGAWFGVDKVVDRIRSTAQISPVTGEMQDKARLDVDEYTLVAHSDFALVGSGGGSFSSVFPQYRQGDVHQFYDHAHNDYLEMLLEYGWVGMILLASLVSVSLSMALRAMRRRRDPLMRGAAFAVVMGSVAIGIHSTVDFNLHIPANAAYLSVLLVLGWVALELRQKGH